MTAGGGENRAASQQSLRAELTLAAITVFWGTTFVLVKAALAEISTFLFLALRFSIAFLALLALYRGLIRRQALWPGLLAGGLLFGGFAFQTLGLRSTTPAKAAFLTGLSIPMVPLASALVYRIRPRLMEIVGILIASTGMMLMTLPDLRLRMSHGDMLSFFCAIVFALHIVVVGHYSPLIGFESLAVFQVGGAALLAIFISSGLAGVGEQASVHWSPGLIAAVLVTGLLATALAFTAQAWAQQYTTATRAALIFSLEPVVAWLTSYLLTGEVLTNRAKVGAITILAGILLVETNRARTEKSGV